MKLANSKLVVAIPAGMVSVADDFALCTSS